MSTSTFDSSDTTGRTSSSVPSSVSSLPSVTLSSQEKSNKGPTRRFFRSPMALGLAGAVVNASLFAACFVIAFRYMNNDSIGASLASKSISVGQEDAISEHSANCEVDPNASDCEMNPNTPGCEIDPNAFKPPVVQTAHLAPTDAFDTPVAQPSHFTPKEPTKKKIMSSSHLRIMKVVVALIVAAALALITVPIVTAIASP
eukprot:GHVT01024026.1.p1 GENE.GHVT01024026.1~~GHVT01024026.1.p1  ORF type:complete len:201 (+),score=17.26 GHVT01024026.1:188-790(+)